MNSKLIIERWENYHGEGFRWTLSVFLKGRKILDVVMLANELVDFRVKQKIIEFYVILTLRRPMTMSIEFPS